jgi:hypothetical protein
MSPDNGSVFGAKGFHVLAVACVLSVPTAVIGDDLIRFAVAVDAHKCCAASGGACAQLSTPDQCCTTQEEAASLGFTSVGAELRTTLVAPDCALLGPSLAAVKHPTVGSVRSDSSRSFTRPHDPPHLHSFPLLI